MDEKQLPIARYSSLGEKLKVLACIGFGILCGISCMSIEIGNKKVMPIGEEPYEQNGELNLVDSNDGKLEIYYPRPYASPPNLTIDQSNSNGASSHIEVVEQKADHFTVKFVGFSPTSEKSLVKWKASGMTFSSTTIIKESHSDSSTENANNKETAGAKKSHNSAVAGGASNPAPPSETIKTTSAVDGAPNPPPTGSEGSK